MFNVHWVLTRDMRLHRVREGFRNVKPGVLTAGLEENSAWFGHWLCAWKISETTPDLFGIGSLIFQQGPEASGHVVNKLALWHSVARRRNRVPRRFVEDADPNASQRPEEFVQGFVGAVPLLAWS